MSHSRLSRGFLVLMVVCLAACTSATGVRPPQGGAPHLVSEEETLAGPPLCAGGGSANKNAPIACISVVNGDLVVSPSPIVAWDVYEKNPAHAVVIQWFAKNPTDTLQIMMKNTAQSCVEKVECQGRHCLTHTLKQPALPKSGQECGYDVVLNGVKYDPVIIVQPCC